MSEVGEEHEEKVVPPSVRAALDPFRDQVAIFRVLIKK